MKSNTSTIPRALLAASAVAALSFGAVACSDDDGDPDDIDNEVDSVVDNVDSMVDDVQDEVDSVVDDIQDEVDTTDG